MMSSEWSSFLGVLAQSSIALLALLFVAFQINRERWITDPMRKLIAIQTLLEFFVPSFFSLIALIPAQPLKPIPTSNFTIYIWQIGGVITSLAGLRIASMVTKYGKEPEEEPDEFGRKQLRLQPIAKLEYSLLLALSIYGTLFGASLIVVWLLISGSYETWFFFSELE